MNSIATFFSSIFLCETTFLPSSLQNVIYIFDSNKHLGQRRTQQCLEPRRKSEGKNVVGNKHVFNFKKSYLFVSIFHDNFF